MKELFKTFEIICILITLCTITDSSHDVSAPFASFINSTGFTATIHHSAPIKSPQFQSQSEFQRSTTTQSHSDTNSNNHNSETEEKLYDDNNKEEGDNDDSKYGSALFALYNVDCTTDAVAYIKLQCNGTDPTYEAFYDTENYPNIFDYRAITWQVFPSSAKLIWRLFIADGKLSYTNQTLYGIQWEYGKKRTDNPDCIREETCYALFWGELKDYGNNTIDEYGGFALSSTEWQAITKTINIESWMRYDLLDLDYLWYDMTYGSGSNVIGYGLDLVTLGNITLPDMNRIVMQIDCSNI